MGFLAKKTDGTSVRVSTYVPAGATQVKWVDESGNVYAMSGSADGLVDTTVDVAASLYDPTGDDLVLSPSTLWDYEKTVAADVSETGQTAVAITGLAIPLVAQGLYDIEAWLKMNSSSAAGVAVAIGGPSGCLISAIIDGEASSTAAQDATHTLSELSAALGTVGSGSDIYVRVRGFAKCAATEGNLTVMQAKVTSGTSIVRAGSFFRARRLA